MIFSFEALYKEQQHKNKEANKLFPIAGDNHSNAELVCPLGGLYE